MPSDHYNRLAKKYGKENIKGKKYRALMEDIISKNTKGITSRLAKMNKDQWGEALRKITPKEKRFILPDIRSVVPPDQFFVNKAVESGKLITDEFRNSLNKNLRDTLESFTPKTGEPNFVIRRGRTAGQINPNLITEFEEKISKTFKNYTKKDPKFGIPNNIRSIAVTEMNSTVNNVKANYMEQMYINNAGLSIKKSWLHHPSRSLKEPRKGHGIVGRQRPKKFHDFFNVPIYQKIGGRLVRTGFELMLYPHDPNASIDQKINCHCEIVYFVKWS
jgi:hypothetical protein